MLKSIISRLAGATPPPAAADTPYETDYWREKDILAGVQFSATLHVTTPLACVQHHTELFDGPPSAAPRYGLPQHGIWVPKAKTFRELGVDLPEFTSPSSPHASDIGPINPREYVPFLIAFRTIFEGPGTDEAKLEALARLPLENPAYRAFWAKHEANRQDFPRVLFYSTFRELPGVGPAIARRLYEHGFRSIAEILSSPDTELLRVKGVSASLLQRWGQLRLAARAQTPTPTSTP